MKNVVKFEIVDHGIEHEQYFQGCGVSFTEFEDCFTGMGSNASEALEDALEQAAQFGYDTSNIEIEQTDDVPAQTEFNHTDCGDDGCFSKGMNYYVSVRVK